MKKKKIWGKLCIISVIILLLSYVSIYFVVSSFGDKSWAIGYLGFIRYFIFVDLIVCMISTLKMIQERRDDNDDGFMR